MKLNLHPKGIPKLEPLGTGTPLKKGGVVVGMRKEGDKEKIYFVGDDCHLLCVGATRSGKSRCLVLESICLLGLAGESIFCSDPKAELFHYTADFLKKLGYEVLVLDFKNPEKSMRYNLLQPIIDAINEGDTDRAEMLAWDLTNNLVGKPEGEKIWTNGECSIIAAAILCVVCDNQKRPEFQNMTNVYWFISEMCRIVILSGCEDVNGEVQRLLSIGVVNLVTGETMEDALDELTEALSEDGMQRYVVKAPVYEQPVSRHEKAPEPDEIIPYRWNARNIRIAVAGSQRRSGVTVTAFNLASWLAARGAEVAYIEVNQNRHLQLLLNIYEAAPDGEHYTIDGIDCYLTNEPDKAYQFTPLNRTGEQILTDEEKSNSYLEKLQK